MSNLLPLALTMGDPAGVGPDIAWRAWQARTPGQRPFYVIAPVELMAERCAHACGGQAFSPLPISDPSQAASAFTSGLPVLPIEGHSPRPGEPDPACAPAIIASIRLAAGHARAGQAAGVVTNPIAKALLYRSGFPHPGHTEFLAELSAPDPANKPSAPPRPVMMLVGGGLRVALATIHQPLGAVPGALSRELLVEIGRITGLALRRDFGLAHPRIGLCGLNPHAGEDGTIGREEIDIINPAAAMLRSGGFDVSDARSGDAIFHEMLGGRFDAIIAMYHDQGLIPVKTLDLWGGVNVTLGLSFIRTSPDHGVAYDAAASGQARPDSLIAALKLASEMASARERS